MNFLKPLRQEEQMHSRRVSAVSVFLAEGLDLSSPEVKVIERAALFHDVGKAALSQELLYKPGSLTRSEQSLILTHTLAGKKMLEGTDGFLSTASTVALQHHERLDGSGYLGLCDKDIHPHAKLVAVVDFFDSLTFRQEDWDIEQVRGELEQRSGMRLDARVVSMLLNNIGQVLDICRKVNAQNTVNTHF